jgi:hypothetical protein
MYWFILALAGGLMVWLAIGLINAAAEVKRLNRELDIAATDMYSLNGIMALDKIECERLDKKRIDLSEKVLQLAEEAADLKTALELSNINRSRTIGKLGAATQKLKFYHSAAWEFWKTIKCFDQKDKTLDRYKCSNAYNMPHTTMTVTVKEILIEYLKSHGYDGLCDSENSYIIGDEIYYSTKEVTREEEMAKLQKALDSGEPLVEQSSSEKARGEHVKNNCERVSFLAGRTSILPEVRRAVEEVLSHYYIVKTDSENGIVDNVADEIMWELEEGK